MHAPLPRDSLPRRMRDDDRPDAMRALLLACAIVVIISVALVGVVLIVGKLTIRSHGGRNTALSSRDLAGTARPAQAEAPYAHRPMDADRPHRVQPTIAAVVKPRTQRHTSHSRRSCHPTEHSLKSSSKDTGHKDTESACHF